jgi:hypothetical protein
VSTTTSTDQARAAFATVGSLARAITVGLGLRPAWSVVDVVVQDEYTHDVVLQAAADGPALVLDCT